MAVIDNVYFFYTKIASPVPAFVKTNSEFVVDCVVDKKTAKEYNKKFQKQKAKEIDNDEFKVKYKVDEVPFPDQDEQYVIKSKKNHIKDGRQTPEKYFPRVLLATENGNVDITYDKQVGNGSFGKLSYRETSNDFGVFAELSAILVENLVEYGGNGGVTADFGAVELKATPDNLKVVQKQEEGVASKSVKKAEPKVEEEEDIGSPF
jgi:hypothetical protein